MTDNEMKQRARDIVADLYHQREWDRSEGFGHEGWGQSEWREHIRRWCSYMREGSYDNDLCFVAAYTALKESNA